MKTYKQLPTKSTFKRKIIFLCTIQDIILYKQTLPVNAIFYIIINKDSNVPVEINFIMQNNKNTIYWIVLPVENNMIGTIMITQIGFIVNKFKKNKLYVLSNDEYIINTISALKPIYRDIQVISKLTRNELLNKKERR